MEKYIPSCFPNLRFIRTNLKTYARTYSITQPSRCIRNLKITCKSSYFDSKAKKKWNLDHWTTWNRKNCLHEILCQETLQNSYQCKLLWTNQYIPKSNYWCDWYSFSNGKFWKRRFAFFWRNWHTYERLKLLLKHVKVNF